MLWGSLAKPFVSSAKVDYSAFYQINKIRMLKIADRCEKEQQAELVKTSQEYILLKTLFADLTLIK